MAQFKVGRPKWGITYDIPPGHGQKVFPVYQSGERPRAWFASPELAEAFADGLNKAKQRPLNCNAEYLRDIVVNDGDGKICGYSYAERCRLAKEPARKYRTVGGSCALYSPLATSFACMVDNAATHAGLYDKRQFTRRDILNAALMLVDYYEAHVKEGA